MQGVFVRPLHEKPWRDRPAVSAWGLRCSHRGSSWKLPLGRAAGLAVVHRIQAVMLQPWGPSECPQKPRMSPHGRGAI